MEGYDKLTDKFVKFFALKKYINENRVFSPK